MEATFGSWAMAAFHFLLSRIKLEDISSLSPGANNNQPPTKILFNLGPQSNDIRILSPCCFCHQNIENIVTAAAFLWNNLKIKVRTCKIIHLQLYSSSFMALCSSKSILVRYLYALGTGYLKKHVEKICMYNVFDGYQFVLRMTISF